MIAQVVLKTQTDEIQECTVDMASDGVSALNLSTFDSLRYYFMLDIGLGEGPDWFQVAVL